MNIKIIWTLSLTLLFFPSVVLADSAVLFNESGDNVSGSGEVIFNNYPTNSISIMVNAGAGGGSQTGTGRAYNGRAEAYIGSSSVVDDQPVAGDGGGVSATNSMTITKNSSGNWMNGAINMGASVWVGASAYFTGENCVCSGGAYGEVTWTAIATGTIRVSSNIPSASFTLTGPATLPGAGTSTTFTNQPTGMYTITWNNVPGYTKPGSTTLSLPSGGTINFPPGTYTPIAPTIDVHF